MMKTIKFSILLQAIALAAFGQAVTTNTTVAVAIDANTNTQWCITSATGVSLPAVTGQGSFLFVDHEAARVTGAGTSSTCFKVSRGQLGTAAGYSHAVGAVVWVSQAATGTGDSSHPFSGGALVRYPPSGSCVAANQFSLPIILLGAEGQGVGTVMTCLSSKWQTIAPSTPVSLGTVVASATTIVPTAFMFHVSGTTAIVNITVPVGLTAGSCLQIVPDAIFTTTAAGNISLASTAVVNKLLFECWDGTKFNPSY